ncbi:MAG: hypothetical protein A3I77_04020 [Gammaproteobacteria bacterium RIFCSPLOWO2_02_FULL_42_14]|nr:MAG: hypothetical protein A3B71_05325 [Gammaproteobacteria bacterium RIFCSPHIGHO2_02_FULL_42_43]OGT27533.1 MAG: hypothetical protein A2624_03775 [Gammaproteobacteria bacterium RIFCSPHIGHO2_01_FULL_42_8]OGT51417.1 MAG: hypothetical protein A3E54_05090 [Gammaproteobacteria bacterium RIFCSPHIGHO2_12_FULL_41_25]OGT62119.1 MAG: hypothetical protein A3I77_04020 [Gammaproteobacteria bacterium RIFCSPLOWO2_02_FULL_42_14]OGT85791.1 MAG: hypothetical protein A3G86_03715 [Gammaproteobacteria bacterium R
MCLHTGKIFSIPAFLKFTLHESMRDEEALQKIGIPDRLYFYQNTASFVRLNSFFALKITGIGNASSAKKRNEN